MQRDPDKNSILEHSSFESQASHFYSSALLFPHVIVYLPVKENENGQLKCVLRTAVRYWNYAGPPTSYKLITYELTHTDRTMNIFPVTQRAVAE